MTPSGTLWLSLVHIPPCKRIPSVMLCSHCPMNDSSGCLHITVYLAVMLQASWHSERVTKGQMVHFSSHDGLQNFIKLTLVNIGPRVCQGGFRVTEVFPSLLNTKFVK